MAEADSASIQSTNKKTSNRKGGTGRASVSIPTLGGGDFQISGDRIWEQLNNDEHMLTHLKKFMYSEPFYPDQVRSALHREGRIKEINSAADINDIHIGQFVEFNGSILTNELDALLDILTPELTAVIARYSHP